MADRNESPLSRAQRLAQTRVYRALLYRLSPMMLAQRKKEAISTKQFANLGVPAVTVVYFADPPTHSYQIDQWLPVFDQLHVRHPVLVVTRNLGTFRYLGDRTELPLVYARRLLDLEDILVGADPKICLYVNNAASNFNALSWRRALHVHLNHGESDKISMASNQAKAYDAVFVAGEAAEVRYKENLLDFDGANLVRVGRPQLDLEFRPALRPSKRRTVIYAPTWEGDTAAMDYTSLLRHGRQLVRRLVSDGAFRVVYRPHPRILMGSKAAVSVQESIVRTLGEANVGVAGVDRHVFDVETPIMALFPSCDVMICDVSSVALDWLYLRTDAPLWICDPHEDRDALVRASPLAGHTYVLDGSALPDVLTRIRESLESDERRSAREEARRFYFGDLVPGESTRRFLDAIDHLVARRDELVDAKSGRGLEIGAVDLV
jgi:hypothetical protein